jgi:hypothetical protein
MNYRSVPLLFVVAVMTGLFAADRLCAQDLAGDESSPTEQIAALRMELERLRGMLPAQAVAMTVVEYNFSNLWFAVHEGNWPLAQFFLSETRARLRWALRITPERRTSSGMVALQPYLDAFEQMPYAEIEKALAREDVGAFEAAYTGGLSACNSCHAASEKAFLRMRKPTAPAGALIDFDGE